MGADKDEVKDKPLNRAQRRLAEKHANKHRPAVEPMPIQIPKAALLAAGSVLVLLSLFGIKSSLQASASSKPFSMEGFEKSKSGVNGDAEPYMPHPRDTDEMDAPNGDWLHDPTMVKIMSTKQCDIERVPYANMTTKRFAREFQGVRPVIIEGLVDVKWPAKTAGRWARSSLMSAFGDSPIHVSSGSGIVHSGGESLRTVTLSDFLEDIRENDGSGPSATSFTFDLEFVEGNPELKTDFKIPTIFRSFNSHESMRRGSSWSIFSLGASGAGLPFHTHGETWLGVVYGAKRWALYSPETPRPYGAEKLAGWHPLMGALEWFQDVSPVLKKTGEAPPLECVQNPGDLIYVPANWHHMTLNLGESVGVGGQALYAAESRLRDGLELMMTMPNDPEVLYSVGVGLAHRGIDALMQEGGQPPALDETELDFDLFMNSLRNGARLTAAETLGLSSASLKKAVADYPAQPETYIILAETLAKSGKLDEAREVIEGAWKLFSRENLPEGIPDATLVVVQLNLARFFLQVEDGENAEAYLKTGPLELEPEHGDAVADLAVALAMQGGDKLGKAAEAIQRAATLGAAGESFERRRTFVMRLMMQAAQRMSAADSEAEVWGKVEGEATAEDEGVGGAFGEVDEL